MDDPGEDFTRLLDAAKLEALVETMYLAAYADGVFSEVERAHFRASVERLTGGRLGPEQFDSVLQRLQSVLADQGRGACLRSIRERLPDPELRWAALLLATDIAAADGVILPSEREVILDLAKALEIESNEAEALIGGFRQEPPASSRK
jgi:tellurite resistance protein